MAYDEYLAERINRILIEKNVNFYEKKMFGGLCFMVEDKMCFGIIKNEIMARLGEKAQPDALTYDGVREMDFTGRSMKGYVYISPEAVDSEDSLEHWVQKALDFNPEAKASKKRK